jgi:Zn-dependent protease
VGEFTLLQKIAIWAIPVIFAITVHEVAHGYVAKRLGDPTAAMLGRLTLNPIRHVDPVGTLLVPALMLLLPGSIIFGWAKPVPIGYRNLRRPKRDMALVAAAGPGVNLLMALGWAVTLRLAVDGLGTAPWVAQPLVYMAQAGISINLVLMVLNLLPIPPLDGSRVLAGVAPSGVGQALARIEPFGLIIVVVLLFTGLLSQILVPALRFTGGLVMALVGLGGPT